MGDFRESEIENELTDIDRALDDFAGDAKLQFGPHSARDPRRWGPVEGRIA